MKFSSNGFYVEKYEKCSICGKLVYADRIEKLDDSGKTVLYCSDWCVEWPAKKAELLKQREKFASL
ncbi:hypothetical protein [Brevibacillus massiliensis]|jgi:alpha-D-ribose 1-methylphosphonate 5-phosphate C-P lyase|uniref:hypothetical protein n=1 Tax=Brevibacillus massiliensis TaxID=1118054 RepID=UPI0002D407B8|nr:hypothetical protein [Brevibacillus massiliensis]